MADRWAVQPHDGADKHFVIDGPLPLMIDYDDVPHGTVDALAEAVAHALNKAWTPPFVRACGNESCDLYWDDVPAGLETCQACGGILGEARGAAL